MEQIGLDWEKRRGKRRIESSALEEKRVKLSDETTTAKLKLSLKGEESEESKDVF